MVVDIPLRTSAGDGEIVFDMLGGPGMVGKLVKVEIPDPVARARFDQLTAQGNPEFVLKIGGAGRPENTKKHLDCIVTALSRMVREEIEGFDFISPAVSVAPGGDVWR